MTVAELIEKLKDFDQSLIVEVYDDGLMSDVTTIEVNEYPPYPEHPDRIVIY